TRHHPDLHSFPTRRSSDLSPRIAARGAVTKTLSAHFSPTFLTRKREHRAKSAAGVWYRARHWRRSAPDSGRTVRWNLVHFVASRSEEHTSELQSRGHLVCR